MIDTAPPSPRVSRAERRAIIGIVLLAAAVRLWDLPRLELSHFDEGVYAYWGQKALGPPWPWQYPYRELYSPPLFPTLVGWSYVVVARSGPSAVLPSALLGVATVAVVWWLGRRLFGPAAGLVAAALLALDDLHITYSRAALVDVSLTFFAMLAILCFCRVMRNGSWAWTVGAGLATGLAWNTKYNGFLPVVVGALAVVVVALHTRAWQRVPGRLGRVALSGLIAAVCYLPWFLHVDASLAGGYGDLVTHQAGYLKGLGGWLHGASHQLASWHVFRFWGTGLVAVGLAAGAVLALVQRRVRLAVLSVVLLVIGLVLGFDYVYLAGAVAWVVEGWRTRSGPAWIPAAWVVVLAVLVPLYTPYTRLVVPLVPVVLLACADLGVRHARRLWGRDGAEPVSRSMGWIGGCLAGAVLLFVAGRQGVHMDLPALWRAATDRGGYARAGQWIATHTPRDAVVRYYAQPPVAFYTPRQLEPVQTPEQLWRPARGPAYLVAGPEPHTHPGAPLVTVPHRPSVPTVLDHLGPWRFWDYLHGRWPRFGWLRIYRVPMRTDAGERAPLTGRG